MKGKLKLELKLFFSMSHYYDKNVKVKSEPQTFKITINDLQFNFKTDNGVFSKNFLDFGTYVLLNNFKPTKENARVLDLCAGYGPVGIVIKKGYPQYIVDLTEYNQRAVELARDNAKINNVDVSIYSGDLFENVPDKSYDYILVNPPIRAGKDVVFKAYDGSYEHLSIGGSLFVVIQKKQGAPSSIKYLEEKFKEVNIIAKEKGYYIIEAIK